MNWSRGLFRLWLVLSTIWLVIAVIVLRPDEEITLYIDSHRKASELAEDLRGYSDQSMTTEQQAALLQAKEARFMAAHAKTLRHRGNIISISVTAFSPPILALAVGGGLLWAMRGFREPRA